MPTKEMLTFLQACHDGNLAVVKDLIPKVNINGLSIGGESALYLASTNNKIHIVRILLDNGANPNQIIYTSSSALHCASTKEYSDILNLLLEKGGDPNLRNDDGETPLHCAAQFGRAESTLTLLNHDADPCLLTNDKQSPLHYAARGTLTPVRPLAQDFRKTIKHLLMAGCCPNLQNAMGDNFYSIASQNMPKLNVESLVTKVNQKRFLVFRPIRQILANHGHDGNLAQNEAIESTADIERKMQSISL